MTSPIAAPHTVCIDGRMLSASATGVGRYADTLLETCRDAGALTLVLNATGAPRRRGWAWPGVLRRGPRLARYEIADRELRAQAQLFRHAQMFFDLHRRLLPVTTDAPPGVMHWTYPVPLHMQGWRNVYTVHDAIPLNQPELTPIRQRRHRRLKRAIVRKADRLITVSDTARDDVIATTDCAASRVISIPQGVTPLPVSSDLPADLSPGGYFLFYGSIEPRKNLVRLMQAHTASGAKRPLVLAGPDGWRAAEVMRHAAGRPGIVRLPYQTRERLGALVGNARAVLFPSLAEGFGLPVIEAMLMGTPVLTSAGGALQETAGGAALLVDPYDGAAMSEAIGRLDREDKLVTELAAAGLQRADAFSIARYAARLRALHTDLMSARP